MRVEYRLVESLDCPLIRLYDLDAAAATRLLRLVVNLWDGQVGGIVLDERQEITLVDSGCSSPTGRSNGGGYDGGVESNWECVLPAAQLGKRCWINRTVLQTWSAEPCSVVGRNDRDFVTAIAGRLMLGSDI